MGHDYGYVGGLGLSFARDPAKREPVTSVLRHHHLVVGPGYCFQNGGNYNEGTDVLN